MQLINKLFNIRENEVVKVAISATIRFLYRVGFVLGWTILVASFVSGHGISALPQLFIFTAVFTIVGSILFSLLLGRLSKSLLMTVSLLAASALLLAAIGLADSQGAGFFALLILAISTFLVQFKIILNSYVEDLFTSLESERTFPIIEASETLGGIVSGLLITFYGNSVDSYRFIYIWIAALILIVPILLIFDHSTGRRLFNFDRQNHHRGIVNCKSKVKKIFSEKKLGTFVKGMVLIVLLQWFIATLLEFQYTEAVYQNISNVVADIGSGFEHALFHDLGVLFLAFSCSSLLMQLFLGSRFLTYLGVMGAMLLHPLVALLSIIPFAFVQSFLFAVLAKNNFVMTTILHTNAYHTSYYAIREEDRDHVREILEGFVRPIGAALATFVLFLVNLLFDSAHYFAATTTMMVLALLAMLFVTYRERENYSKLVIAELKSKIPQSEKLNVIDILGQAGHKNSELYLIDILKDKSQATFVRVKVLRTLGEMKDLNLVSEILPFLKSKDLWLKEVALDTLQQMVKIKNKDRQQIFASHKLFEQLKEFINSSRDEALLAKALDVMSSLSSISTLEFLINRVKNTKGKRKNEALLALGSYDDDIICELIRPYLQSKNSETQIYACIALRNQAAIRDEIHHLIFSYYYSSVPKKIAYSMFAMAKLRMKGCKKHFLRHLDSEDRFVRMHAALALTKIGSNKGIKTLREILFSNNKKLSNELFFHLRNASPTAKKYLKSAIRSIIDLQLRKGKGVDRFYESIDLAKFDSKDLQVAQKLLTIVNAYDEAYIISAYLKN